MITLELALKILGAWTTLSIILALVWSGMSFLAVEARDLVQEEEAKYVGCCECGELGHGCNDCPVFC